MDVEVKEIDDQEELSEARGSCRHRKEQRKKKKNETRDVDKSDPTTIKSDVISDIHDDDRNLDTFFSL